MKILNRKLLTLLLLALLAIALSGCASSPYTNRSQFIIMDEETEMSLSADAYQQFTTEEKIEKGTQRAKMITNIGNRIAAVADRPNYEWEFLVVADDEVINAMCLPGGKVFVYTGIIKLTGSNENELAAIMGHEIAHALARHGAESASVGQSAAIGSQIIGIVAESVIGGGVGEAAGSLAGTLTSLGLTLPHSRMQESEADEIGLILMAKAGYNPQAAVTLWEKMAKQNEGNEPMSFLSTHPLSSDRITAIQAQLPSVMPYYEEYQQKNKK